MLNRTVIMATAIAFMSVASQASAAEQISAACQIGAKQVAPGSLVRIPLAIPYGGSVMRLCDNGQLGEPMYSDEDYEFPGDDPWAVTVISLADQRLVVAGR